MRLSFSTKTILILFLFSCISLNSKLRAQSAVSVTDSLALVSLYKSTQGDQWKKKNGWLTGKVSTWYGITVKNGRVTQINLTTPNGGNNLQGNLPATVGNLTALISLIISGSANDNQNLSGSIPESIGQLKELIILDLSNNNLENNLPNNLKTLAKLQMLDLSGNQLTGALPATLGQLQNLTKLNLDYNQLSDPIPEAIFTLSKLESLSLAENNLSGILPAAIGDLPHLKYLYLFGNALTGPLPASIKNLDLLEGLYLADNKFNGNLPAALGELTKLKVLDLSGNQINGTIPASFRNLHKLQELYLSDNQLKGTIPDFGALQDVTVLDLSYNQLEGTLPDGVWQLEKLFALNVSHNKMEGDLANPIENLTNAKWIGLSHNYFAGELPDGIGKLSQLQLLYLENNRFSGPVPKTFNQLSSLQTLSLANNELEVLPDLSSLNSLKKIFVERNQFSFDDLLPNYSISGFYYLPQDTIAITDTVTLQSGMDYMIKLDIDKGISTNTYHWYKNEDKVATTDINQLPISQATIKDAGLYTCKINNSKISDLTLVSQSVYLQVQPGELSQQITFDAIPDKTFGDSAFDLSVYSDAELPITLQCKGPIVLEGKSITITGAGEATVTAFQNGNDNYLPADSITQQFTINKAIQSITFDTIPNKALGDTRFALEAASDAGLPVSFEIVNGEALLEGNLLTPTHEGTIAVRAYSAGNENYKATEAIRSFSVSKNIKKTQTITLDTIPDKTFDDAPFALQSTSDAGLPVSCKVISGPATLDDNLLTITGTGQVEILAFNTGNEQYKADSVIQAFNVLKASQTITFVAIPDKTFGDTPFALQAISDVALPVSFKIINGPATLEENKLTINGAGTIEILAFQRGNELYKADSIAQNFIVSKATQTITFDTIPDKLLGDAPFMLEASASSGLPIHFSVTGPAVLEDHLLTLTDTGTVFITTSQSGDTNYLPAAAITRTFRVEAVTLVTGTEEINTADNIIIYPNPTTGKFTISLNIQEWKSGTLTIRNLSGQLITTTSIDTAQIDVHLEKEPAGLYLITLQQDQTHKNFKITIE